MANLSIEKFMTNESTMQTEMGITRKGSNNN